MSLQNKKMVNHIKGHYKTAYFKTSPTFLSLSFLIDCCISAFPLSNVILAFLDHLSSKIFLVGQPW